MSKGLDSGKQTIILVLSMTIYTAEFARRLAQRHGRAQAHYHQALVDILNGIAEELAAGESVQLTGFGTFYTRQRPAGILTDLRTGRKIAVPPMRVAGFRVGEILKQAARQRPVGRPPRRSVTSLLARAGSRIMKSAGKPAPSR